MTAAEVCFYSRCASDIDYCTRLAVVTYTSTSPPLCLGIPAAFIPVILLFNWTHLANDKCFYLWHYVHYLQVRGIFTCFYGHAISCITTNTCGYAILCTIAGHRQYAFFYRRYLPLYTFVAIGLPVDWQCIVDRQYQSLLLLGFHYIFCSYNMIKICIFIMHLLYVG